MADDGGASCRSSETARNPTVLFRDPRVAYLAAVVAVEEVIRQVERIGVEVQPVEVTAPGEEAHGHAGGGQQQGVVVVEDGGGLAIRRGAAAAHRQ